LRTSRLQEDVPYVVVAHSLGNWVAFETLRLARQRGVPMPRIFFSSCMPAPSIADQLKVRLSCGRAGGGGWRGTGAPVWG
jgi:surfactin synthase thioesterase subunit